MTHDQHSVDRVLTTHVGSLPRPPALLDMMAARGREASPPADAEYDAAIEAAVADCVRRQVQAGIDVVCDGEQSKPGFFAYARERMSGLDADDGAGDVLAAHRREIEAFPEYYEQYFREAMLGGTAVPISAAVCTGPISYVGTTALERDLENLRAAASDSGAGAAFVPAVAPSGLARNDYYPSQEAYWEAAGEALRVEYAAIIDAGFVLQIDDPFVMSFFSVDGDLSEEQRRADAYVEVLNHSLRGLPPESLRYHICYSINEGPRVFDVPFARVAPSMLRVNAAAYTFEAGNPRHEHEYHVWETVTLPEDKIVLPGLIAHANNIVEHPELIAERLIQFAERVGRENVVASVDCGFSSQATYRTEVHPTVVWAKLAALAEGARLASERLWP